MKAIVDSGQVPGLIAYKDNEPAGWCSVAPREHYAGLERSRVLKWIDDKPVWSLPCFFIHKYFRGQGMGEKLIRGAIAYVKEQGGSIIEAYPTAKKPAKLPPVTSFMGIQHVLERCGFVEVSQPSKTKVIMRYSITTELLQFCAKYKS